MGESSQFEKMLKKLNRTLDKCEAEHIFRGAIFEFDTVGSVPKERLVKGMLIDRKEGMRRVSFSSNEMGPSAMVTSSLKVGDAVVILGAQHSQRESATLPKLILHPAKQTLLFAREPEDFLWGGRYDTAQAILYGMCLVLCALWWIGPVLLMYWDYNMPLILTAAAVTLLFVGSELYQRHVQRARIIQFDSRAWEHVVSEINSRFNVEI